MDWIVKNNIAIGQLGTALVNDVDWSDVGLVLGDHNLTGDTSGSAFGGSNNVLSKTLADTFDNAPTTFVLLNVLPSPAIDAGEDLSSLFGNDAVGVSRPVGGAWDIGALEYNGPFAASYFQDADITLDWYAPLTGNLASQIKVLGLGASNLAAQTTIIQYSPDDVVVAAEILVAPHPRSADLAAQIVVARNGQNDQAAQIKIEGYFHLAQADVRSQILLVNNSTGFNASILIDAVSQVQAQIAVAPIYVPASIRVLRTGTKDLPAQIGVVQEAPGSPAPVSSSVDPRYFSPIAERTFYWNVASYVNSPVASYRWKLIKDPNLEPSLAWNYVSGSTFHVDVDMTSYHTGYWYFLVAARNSNNVFGPAASVKALYGVPPGVPGTTYMRINQFNTISFTPLVSRNPETSHVLSWTPSAVEDVTVSPIYRLRIATQPDFGVSVVNGQTSLVKEVENLLTNSASITPSLPVGVYYWQVQASNGYQNSAWSLVGSFRVNAPPKAPTRLRVEQVA